MEYNYTAYIQRNTAAIRKNLSNNMRNYTIKRACELLRRFDEYLQDEAVNLWTSEFNLSKKLLNGYLKGETAPTLSPADELREFLLTLDIKQNSITGEQTIIYNKKSLTVDELELILETENYNTKYLRRFLDAGNKNITVVKKFNPLADLMRRLADNYKGENLISELASCIPATQFADKEAGHYQKRLEYYLRKWLMKAAGQAMGIGRNDAMLLWIEPLGGSGKSYINRWLFSLPEFKNYYVRIGENASFIDMSGLSKGKFIIDWDELPLSKKRYQTFKSTIAAEEIQIYNKKTKTYENFNRNVNFIGSTNKANRERQKGFLLDDDDAMKRRIIPIDLTGRIDYEKYTKDIDLYQLWGEAAAGILLAQRNNNKNMLTYECDYDDLREQNRRYVNLDDRSSFSIIFSIIKPAQQGTGVLLSSSEIIEVLNDKGIKHKLTPEKVGRKLNNYGYDEGRTSKKRGYWVKLK
jgi:hypothetical protein